MCLHVCRYHLKCTVTHQYLLALFAVTNELPEENLAMYIALVAAVAVFVAIAIIVVLVFKRRLSNSKLCFSGEPRLQETPQQLEALLLR